MTYASEDLRNEHDGILFGLDILEKMAGSAQKPGETDIADAREMVRFLRLFADKCHHGKEEGLFFPALEKVGIPNQGSPIGQMLLEHTQGRQFIAAMGASAEGGILETDSFMQAASGYIRLMRAHIEKENTILFPMGDRMLPPDEQAKLLSQFEAFEENVIGGGVHEGLHETLHMFGEKYLKG